VEHHYLHGPVQAPVGYVQTHMDSCIKGGVTRGGLGVVWRGLSWDTL